MCVEMSCDEAFCSVRALLGLWVYIIYLPIIFTPMMLREYHCPISLSLSLYIYIYIYIYIVRAYHRAATCMTWTRSKTRYVSPSEMHARMNSVRAFCSSPCPIAQVGEGLHGEAAPESCGNDNNSNNSNNSSKCMYIYIYI